jgi:integrase
LRRERQWNIGGRDAEPPEIARHSDTEGRTAVWSYRVQLPHLGDASTASYESEGCTPRFGTMLDARNLLRALCAIIRTSDVPRLRFHDLRHSAATLLLVQGVHPKVVAGTRWLV